MTDEQKPAEASEFEGERLQAMLDRRDFRSLRRLLKDAEPADIGEGFAELEMPSVIVLFRMVPKEQRSQVFSYLPFERQEELIEELPDIVVTAIVNDMEPDDRTRLLEELPFEIRNKVMLRLSPEERRMAWQLLSYPEDSIGRLMTPEFIELTDSMSVKQALDSIRWSESIPDDQLNVLYIADNNGNYVGEVNLATLVLADPPTKKLGEVMNASQVSLDPMAEQSEAVDTFRKYDKPFFPVVTEVGELVGVVSADDVFDVAEEEATEDIHQFGGQSGLEDSYFQTPLMTLFRKRAGWLVLLFFGGIFTAALLRHYEAMTATMVWLVFFVPLIISSGGNTGSQAASLVIRGLAVREMEPADWFKVAYREFVVCGGLGLVLGLMGFVLAITWDMEPVVGLVVALSIFGVVVFGGIAGALLPFAFKRLNLDPAVSSSPLLASLVDVFGVLILFNTAAYIIAMWQKW